MNESGFHALLREWLRSEAPSEAPDWIVEHAIDRATALERTPPTARRWPAWQPLVALVVLLLILTIGIGALYALMPRPPQPAPTPRADVLRHLSAGSGQVLGLASDERGIWVANNSLPGVVLLDAASGQVLAEVVTYDRPPTGLAVHPVISDVVAAFGFVWTVDDEYDTVTRIDSATAETLATIRVAQSPRVAAAAAGGLWVLSPASGILTRIHSVTGNASSIPLDAGAASGMGHVAGNEHAIWVALEDELIQVDPDSERVVGSVSLGAVISGLVADDSGAWVISSRGLTAVGRGGDAPRTAPLPGDPGAVALAGGLVWVADRRDDTIRGFDPRTRSVVETLAIGTGATDIAVAGSTMAVLNQLDRTVTLIQLAD